MKAFRRFAIAVADAAGTPWAFAGAVAVIIAWAVCGPFLNYSSAWQLVINTGTTIVTFLMLFLVQYTQNRNERALHLKLDALLTSLHEAPSEIARAEEQDDAELARLREAL